MPQLLRWFDIPDLRTPFLAINLSNRNPASRETNAQLLPRRQTGHWALPKAALEHGLEGRPIVLFYSGRGSSTIYVGTCVSKKQTDRTRNNRPRYTITVARRWEDVGEADVRFSAFFAGFPMSANPATVWVDLNRYTPPAGETVGLEDRDVDEEDGEDQEGEGGYGELVMTTRRFGHRLFVQRLMEFWRKRCALTNIKAPRLVQACHIVPWSEAIPVERVDRNNGLLLCAHLHALLDSHLLSFDTDGHLMLAKDIGADVRALVLAGHDGRLRKTPSAEQVDFLLRHRKAASEVGRRLERV